MTHFNYNKFSDVADDLYQNKEEEYIRSAVSRYYYSIFGVAREYLIKTNRLNPNYKKGDIHQKIPQLLSLNETEEEISEYYKKMRLMRNEADYSRTTNKKEFNEELKYMPRKIRKYISLIENLMDENT